jgi:hypothetical protein
MHWRDWYRWSTSFDRLIYNFEFNTMCMSTLRTMNFSWSYLDRFHMVVLLWYMYKISKPIIICLKAKQIVIFTICENEFL